MASKIVAQAFEKAERPVKAVDQSMLTDLLDDNRFMNEIIHCHAHDESRDIDVQPLFELVKNTLHGSLGIVESVVNPKGSHGSSVFKPPKTGLTLPLSTISEVGCQMTCKALDNKNVRGTVVSVFHELTPYSWVAKAVLTLSAFALHYADFWRLAHFPSSDWVLESMAILKGLPAITKLDPQKIQVFGELNEMVKTTLEMTECIVDFENDSKDVPELSMIINTSESVYQIIMAVLACSIQFTALISGIDDYKGQDLHVLAPKVNMICHTIKRHYEEFKQKKAEIRDYQRLKSRFLTPTDNVELIKSFFYIKDNPQPLFIGSKKATDKVESLRRKRIMLLISDLRLLSYDLSIMRNIYKERKFHESQHEIIWIPVVDEQVGEESLAQYKNLQAQMEWYSAQTPTVISRVAIRLIREMWHFRQESMVVLLNPLGRVENPNALNLIRLFGWDAFPFTESVGNTFWDKRRSWFDLIVTDLIFPKITEAIKAGKYIFLYGGEDAKTVQEFEDNIKKITDDGISIVAVNVGKSQLFWTRLESCMLSKLLQTKADIREAIMQDMLKLFTSFKRDRGFAVLSRGPDAVVNSSLVDVSKVLSQYDTWKKQVGVGGKTFDFAIKEYYDRSSVLPCCHHFYIPNMAGYTPEDVECPICPSVMRNIAMFECCHGAH